MTLEKREGQSGKAALFAGIDRLGRVPRVGRFSRLDLHKHDRSAVQGHQIDLAQSDTVPPDENPVPKTFQVPRGGCLAAGDQRPGAEPLPPPGKNGAEEKRGLTLHPAVGSTPSPCEVARLACCLVWNTPTRGSSVAE